MKSHTVKTYSVFQYWAITIVAMVVCGVACLPIQINAEECACPELGNLIEDSRDLLGLKDDVLPMARGICLQPPQKTTGIQWFGVALEEPMGGALFALDCSGKVLGVTRIGSVVKLTFHPPLEDLNAIVRVDYIAKVAQGYGLQRVALVAYQNKKIRELWSRDSFEANFADPAKDGTETTYSFQFSPDGKTISVSGKIKIYPAAGEHFIPENVTTRTLKPRRFCWEPRGAFKECGDE
jgi:hypothetical protein